MPLPPRPEIEKLRTGYHGGLNYAELAAMGLTADKVLDFSVCTNPFTLPAIMRKISKVVAINQYPDSEATELKHRLAEKLGVTPADILVGSGTTELIRLTALTYFRPGDSVLILEPTFDEYEIASQIAGANPIKQWAKAKDNFILKTAETVNLIKQHQPRGVFICNPNNPTGKYLSREEIETILDAGQSTLFILDEAYVNFVANRWSSTDLISRDNVIILRSMTKDYALAGLRLGYALANQEIIRNLRRVRPPWNVNVIAQKAGIMALGETNYLEQSQKKIQEAKQFLINELKHLGFPPLPSDTNYFLVKVGKAKTFRTALLKRGILVRDGTPFGLPEYVRIAPRTLPKCRQLIATLSELKKAKEIT